MKRKDFWRLVYKTSSGCWLWMGYRNKSGYGVTHFKGRLAHRKAYEYVKGKIPRGKVLDHLCVNRPCVNPAHLEPVTQAENNRRSRTERGRWLRTQRALGLSVSFSELEQARKRGPKE